jgi:hypothetical protein
MRQNGLKAMPAVSVMVPVFRFPKKAGFTVLQKNAHFLDWGHTDKKMAANKRILKVPKDKKIRELFGKRWFVCR